jgi:hypothetical protein
MRFTSLSVDGGVERIRESHLSAPRARIESSRAPAGPITSSPFVVLDGTGEPSSPVHASAPTEDMIPEVPANPSTDELADETPEHEPVADSSILAWRAFIDEPMESTDDRARVPLLAVDD